MRFGKQSFNQRLCGSPGHRIISVDISSALLAGPRPGVDYGKLAAEVPKIRAQLDYIDKTLFIATPLNFATLIDQKPDSKNHLSHLIITKEEREKLVHDLAAAFGKKLEQRGKTMALVLHLS